MAQCKAILDNGARCSNQAVPGTEFCEPHKDYEIEVPRARIRFQKIEPKQEAPDVSVLDEAPFPELKAIPIGLGRKPSFSALEKQDRGVWTAPMGIIYLPESNEQPNRDLPSSRLANFLCAFSEKFALHEVVDIQVDKNNKCSLIWISPPDDYGSKRSVFYDAAATVASLQEGLLLIGRDQLFVQYRDSESVLGFDVEMGAGLENNKLYLVDANGVEIFDQQDLEKASAREVIHNMRPNAISHPALPHTIYLVAAQSFYSMLSRYFKSHYLNFQVARTIELNPGNGDQYLLFEINAIEGAYKDQSIPPFIISFLSQLPQSVVLSEAFANTTHRILVQWGYQCPGTPEHIWKLFPPDSLTIFSNKKDVPNITIEPQPEFFQGNELIRFHPAPIKSIQIQKDPDPTTLSMDIPLRLVGTSGQTGPTSAIILDPVEANWASYLFYQFPAAYFRDLRLCPGKNYSVLLNENGVIESLPFGIPMQCYNDTMLFIPLAMKFIPDVPFSILSEVLGLKPDTFTFLSSSFRIDVPRSQFFPLSHKLFVKEGPSAVNVDFKPPTQLPQLNWKALQPSKETYSVFEQDSSIFSPPASSETERIAFQPSPKANFRQVILEKALQFQASGDYLSAAVCYSILEDNASAARNFQKAAKIIENAG